MPYTCPTCGRDDFKSLWGMKSHHKHVHGESIAGVENTCRWCGDDFTTSYTGATYCSDDCRLAALRADHPNKKEKVAVECEWCGEINEYQPSVAEGRRFCSQECQAEWQSSARSGENHPSWTRVELTCEQCGETYYIKESHAEGSRFCSYDCKYEWQKEAGRFNGDENPMRGLSGEKSPFWKGGHERYYGANWLAQREKRLEKDGYTCQACGASEEDAIYQLEVHHIRPIRTFDKLEDANTMDNLITLCRPCHVRWEGIPLRPDV